MKKLFAIGIVTILCMLGSPVLRGTGNTLWGSTDLPEETNLHFDETYCTQCHEKVPEKGKGALLRFGGDFGRLCRCHYHTRGRCPHPADIKPSEAMRARIPAEFPLQEKKLACTTCHDVYRQCRESRVDRLFPTGDALLRGAPFSSQTAFCFRCHNKEAYKGLNPHDQLDGSGTVVREKCLFCHIEKPDEKRSGYKDVTLIGDFEMLCLRCHYRVKANKQSLHAVHVRKPSPKVLAKIHEAEETFNTILPLDTEGKVTCVTCHNPHEKGVIPAEKPAAKGAGEKYKQRTPGNMCIACHVMQEGISPSKLGS